MRTITLIIAVLIAQTVQAELMSIPVTWEWEEAPALDNRSWYINVQSGSEDWRFITLFSPNYISPDPKWVLHDGNYHAFIVGPTMGTLLEDVIGLEDIHALRGDIGYSSLDLPYPSWVSTPYKKVIETDVSMLSSFSLRNIDVLFSMGATNPCFTLTFTGEATPAPEPSATIMLIWGVWVISLLSRPTCPTMRRGAGCVW